MTESIFNRSKLGLIPILFIFIGMIIPLIVMVFYAVGDNNKIAEPIWHYIYNEPYLSSFKNTLIISFKVCIWSMIISTFITYSLTISKKKLQALIILAIITSLWLSILVRSYAWILIFQKNGVLNALISFIYPKNQSVSLMYSQTTVIIGMVHILCPYIILIQWAEIKDKLKSFIPISNSIGANSTFYFFSIYLPSTWKPLLIGGVLVFIISLGYYITPLLLGQGSSDSLMVSMLIEEQINTLANWKVGAMISINLMIIFFLLLGGILAIPIFKELIFGYINEKRNDI